MREALPISDHLSRSARQALAVAAALGLSAAMTLGLCGPGLHPPDARASARQMSIMMDDDQLLYRGARTRERTLSTMRSLGVNAVRVTVLWSVVAARARSTPARARRFRGDQPATYPPGTWAGYDQLVRSAQARGIAVYFDVTGPGPSWSHARAPRGDARDRKTWMPNATRFAQFVSAVGRRYSGNFRDGGVLVPRVSMWSLWNEPNQGGWLTPQWGYSRALHQVIAESPIIYRQLYLLGRRALDRTGHSRDFIMAGETAPLGTTRRTVRSAIGPRRFIDELMCADRRGRPYQGRAAAARGCSLFARYGPVRASAWAHHPYTKKLAPNRRDPNPDSITMANLRALPGLLDHLAATTKHVSRGLALVSSEYGYETKPPDPYSGIPLARQAAWINGGDYITYRIGRVVGQTQFQLTDAPPVPHAHGKRRWFNYQAGLMFVGNRPKPSFAAYALPFMAFVPHNAHGPARVGVWGQLRFRASARARLVDRVEIQFRRRGARAWKALGAPILVKNRRGFFTGAVQVPGPGSLRAHWAGSARAGARSSRTVAVSG